MPRHTLDRTARLALAASRNVIGNLNSHMHRWPMVTEERVRWSVVNRYAPIRGLTPEILTSYLDNWALGYLRQCALAWDAIAMRDYILRTVIPKRLASAAGQPWQVVIPQQYSKDPEAERHKAALEYFYQNIRVTDALKPDTIGGFERLVKQMLWAHGMGYAIHEILWRQDWAGISATMVNVPSWFFERRTGKLRFLLRDYDIDGVTMEKGSWLVTVGDTLMEACSVCWMYKNLLMKDWLTYSEKQSMPAIFGRTKGAPSSPQWLAMEDAVVKILSGAAGVINAEDAIEKISFAAEGTLPQPQLIDILDRALSALWRGADLSTMSAGQGQGQGASIQNDEANRLTSDDLALVSGVLQLGLDPIVIEYSFGIGTMPKAYISVGGAKRLDVQAEVAVDKFLLESGAPMGVEDTLERYGRTRPDEGEELLSKPEPAPSPFGAAPSGQPPQAELGGGELPLDEGEPGGGVEEEEEPEELAQEKVRKADPALADIMRARLNDLRPVLKRVAQAVNEDDPARFADALASIQSDLPSLLPKNPGLAAVIERRLVAAYVAGRKARVNPQAANAVEFEEEEHPRAEDGKFTSGGGAAVSERKRGFSGHVGRPDNRGGSQEGGVRNLVGTVVGRDGQRTLADGSPLPQHIAAMRIPPAWTDVKVAQHADSDLLVQGKDAKGRIQSVYSESHSASAAAAKFARTKELIEKRDEIVAQNSGNMNSADRETRENAAVMSLVLATGIRPGSDKDTRAAKQAYGATTLEGRHVVISGNDVSLRFVGKKGVALDIPITDEKVKAMLIERKRAAGDKGRLFDTDAGSLLDYAHSLDGGRFKTKDFRTLKGTTTAIAVVASIGAKPRTMKEYVKVVKQVARRVASVLGNTPTVALQSYIDPLVFSGLRPA